MIVDYIVIYKNLNKMKIELKTKQEKRQSTKEALILLIGVLIGFAGGCFICS